MDEDAQLYGLSSTQNLRLPLWLWQNTPERSGWPSRRAWLRRAERRVVRHAKRMGVTPIGDPVAVAEVQSGGVVITASVMAWGPPGRAPMIEGPVDIVDQPDHGGDR